MFRLEEIDLDTFVPFQSSSPIWIFLLCVVSLYICHSSCRKRRSPSGLLNLFTPLLLLQIQFSNIASTSDYCIKQRSQTLLLPTDRWPTFVRQMPKALYLGRTYIIRMLLKSKVLRRQPRDSSFFIVNFGLISALSNLSDKRLTKNELG